METILFILILAAVFAVKAVAIARGHDSEVAKSASFSWVRPGVHDEALAHARAMEHSASAAWGSHLQGSGAKRYRPSAIVMPRA